MKKIMVISWSVLERVASGDIDGAQLRLMGQWPEPTPAQLLGRKMHEGWENETNKTGQTPAEFDIGINGQSEMKLETMVDTDILFKGFVDFVSDDFETIIDYKTGVGSSTDASTSLQLPFYAFLIRRIHKKQPTTGYICHFNTITKTRTISKIHLTEALIERAIEYAATFTSDLRASCEAAGLRWWREIESDL